KAGARRSRTGSRPGRPYRAPPGRAAAPARRTSTGSPEPRLPPAPPPVGLVARGRRTAESRSMTQQPDVGDEAFRAGEHELGLLSRGAGVLSAEVARDVHPELEPGPYGLLVRLDEAAPARSSDLAGYFGVGKATISRQLKALEELGLIEREPDPADGRAHLL